MPRPGAAEPVPAAAPGPARRATGRGLRAVIAVLLACALRPALAADDADAELRALLAPGQAAVERQDWDGAMRELAVAHAAAVQRWGADDERSLTVLHRQADAAIDGARLAEAETLLGPLVQARLRRNGEAHPETLRALDDQAWVWDKRGRLREAGAGYERVVAGRRALGPGHEKALLQTLNNLSLVLAGLGEIERAMAINAEVISGRTERLGPTDPATLRARNNRSHLLGLLGRLAEMLDETRRVVELTRATRGEGNADTLTAMNNEAVALQRLGRQAQALALHERVLAARRALLGARHPDLLQSLGNLAVLSADLGRVEQADALAAEASGLALELLGERHPLTLTLLNNQATAAHDAGRTADAATLLQRVLALRREAFGERHDATIESLHNLAELQLALGRGAEQVRLYEQVLSLRRQVQGERARVTIVAMGNLASAYRRQGRIDEAVALHRQAVVLADEVMGPAHPSTLGIVGGLIRSLHVAAQGPAALRLAERYVEAAEAHRAQPGLSGANRRAVFQRHAATYRLLARLHVLQGQHEQAWRLMELGKARTLLEGLGLQQALRAGVLPPEDAERLDGLGRQLAAADALVAQAGDAGARAAAETRRNELAREHQRANDELRRLHPRYDRLLASGPVDAAEVDARLPAGHVAIAYLVSDDEVLAFVLRSGQALQVLELGRVPDLAPLVDLQRRALAWQGGLRDVLKSSGRRLLRLADGTLRAPAAGEPAPQGSTAVEDGHELARWLSARLLQPLAAAVGGSTEWIVVPDGPLGQLPFEALPWGAGARPLSDSVELRHAPSMSVWRSGLALSRHYRGDPRPQGLFAMGNPHYEARPAPGADLRRRRSAGAVAREVRDLRQLDDQWPQLPGTELEVRSAAARFPGRARVELGPLASEARLQALDRLGELRRYRYLLFSAHGYVSPTRPELSSLVLSLQGREPGTDGYVTAAEWAGYELRSDLVVLSACDTAVGPVLAGEGVMGLPFALQLAGSANTLLTLWPVDDRATAHFVSMLFERLAQGASPARALAQARRQMMRHPRWSHPRFWAPFMLVGPG
jgi:tetratricopeptide (TPR) repeat protein